MSDELREILSRFSFHHNPQPEATENTIAVFVAGSSDPATAEQIDDLLLKLNERADPTKVKP